MARLLSAKYRPVREIRAETEPYTHTTIALAGAMLLMLNKTPRWHTMGAGAARVAVKVWRATGMSVEKFPPLLIWLCFPSFGIFVSSMIVDGGMP